MRELYGMFMKMEKEGKPDATEETAQQEDTTQGPSFDLRNPIGAYD